MVWPKRKPGALPHREMPDDAKVLYEEARSIASDSPRGAVGLLRVAVDVLLREVITDAGNKSLNDVVGMAVSQGLNPQVQQALDSLRVIGNDAVHPKQLVLQEENAPEIFTTLCILLNLVVEQLVSAPRMAAEMFASLPESNRAAIEKRDGSNS